MKIFSSVLLASVLLLGFSAEVSALPARVLSGYILLSGTSNGTPDYQTYLRYDLSARTGMPRRDYRMLAEQPYSVFLNFPARPNGKFDYRVVMPYGPQGLRINGETFAPVWYGDSEWKIQSEMATPFVTNDSPPLLIVSSPFTMIGSTLLLGAYNIGFKTIGSGTLQVRFENLGGKYYMRDAQFTFGDRPPASMLTR